MTHVIADAIQVAVIHADVIHVLPKTVIEKFAVSNINY